MKQLALSSLKGRRKEIVERILSYTDRKLPARMRGKAAAKPLAFDGGDSVLAKVYVSDLQEKDLDLKRRSLANTPLFDTDELSEGRIDAMAVRLAAEAKEEWDRRYGSYRNDVSE